MKKANKISLIVTICLIAMVGISAVFFSVVLAKYVVKQKREKEQATPSNFELIMNSDDATLLYVDFAESGDTSPEVGTRTVFRTYDFSVRTLNSEVESNYVLSIFLPEKLYEKIIETDKTQKGIWVNFKVYIVTDKGLETETLTEITESSSSEVVESSGAGTWKYSETLAPGKNPSNAVGQTDYRLEFEVINVSDLTEGDIPYLAVTNMEISVESTQVV